MWPPQLPDLKDDLAVQSDDQVGDDGDPWLQAMLNAAIAIVERDLDGVWDFTGSDVDIETGLPLPPPPFNVWLGTIRLAARLNARRSTPEGLVQLGELGSTQIPSFDVDIARLLGVGPFAPPTLA